MEPPPKESFLLSAGGPHPALNARESVFTTTICPTTVPGKSRAVLGVISCDQIC